MILKNVGKSAEWLMYRHSWPKWPVLGIYTLMQTQIQHTAVQHHDWLWYVLSNGWSISHRNTQDTLEGFIFFFFTFSLLYTHIFAVPNKLRKPFPRSLKRQTMNWPKVSGLLSSLQEGLKGEVWEAFTSRWEEGEKGSNHGNYFPGRKGIFVRPEPSSCPFRRKPHHKGSQQTL